MSESDIAVGVRWLNEIDPGSWRERTSRSSASRPSSRATPPAPKGDRVGGGRLSISPQNVAYVLRGGRAGKYQGGHNLLASGPLTRTLSQHHKLAMTIIPTATVQGFVLPNGKPDSFLDDLGGALLETFGVFTLFAAAVFGAVFLPAGFVAASIILIMAGTIALLLVIQHNFDNSNFLDCDHDGDPADPNDQVGFEC